MKDEGIGTWDRCVLFRTLDTHWRVMVPQMDFIGHETVYWGPSLHEAMRHFGFQTARKPLPPPPKKETKPSANLSMEGFARMLVREGKDYNPPRMNPLDVKHLPL